jgi:tetratricopeptide (TPR) repeat protein
MASNDSQTPAKPAPGAGDAFFERAEQVAETGNWDFAIDMYLKGVQRDPDNVERGHQPLREVAIKRTAMGGKGLGMMGKLKARPGKDPLENLIKFEGMMAKEPGTLEFMMGMLKAAQQLELTESTPWVARLVVEAQKAVQPKVNKRMLIDVANAFTAMEMYSKALEACDLARLADRDDPVLAQMIGELSTKFTIQQGGYGQEGDFTKGVKDMELQKELAKKDQMTQDKEFLENQIEKARAEYLQDPGVAGKVNAYVDALLKIEDEAHENQAIEVLNQAHGATGAYQFKMRIDDIRIRQHRRKIHEFDTGGDKASGLEQRKQLLRLELDVFAERAVNYPTDLGIKYELGQRQYLAGRFDDAIGNLQQASNDPRRRLRAMNYLGLAFAKKSWFREAAETFEKALQGDVPELRTKELLYNLGEVRIKMDDYEGAQDALSRLAQIDFNYKDVREKMDGVRKKLTPDQGG